MGNDPEPGTGPPPRHPVERPPRPFSANSYGLVLLLILLTYVVSIAAEDRRSLSIVVAMQIATIWVVLRASEARRSVRRIAAVFVGISATVATVNLFVPDRVADEGFMPLVSGLLYLAAPFSVVRHLVLRRRVDRETVLGAIAAYLLIGMFFAFAYRAAGAMQADAFFGTSGDGTFPQDLFFSFTTLTTTGYGNLIPAGNPGQSLAILEMLIGQLFLVIAVAKAVGAWQPKPWRDDRPRPSGG